MQNTLSSYINSTVVLFAKCSSTHLAKTFSRAGIKHLAQRTAMQLTATIAPKHALQRALDLFITPPRYPQSTQEKRLLDSADAMSIATPYGKIAAWRIGDRHRPAIIISHGWGGRGAQLRTFVAPLVNAGYQVVLFDHIGHGLSEGRQAALVDFWRGLEAVWDRMVDDGIAVHGMVGHSLGSAAVASVLRRSLTRKHIDVPTPRVVLIAPPASLIRYSHFFARTLGIPERIRRAMQWRFEQRYGVSWEEFELPQSVCNNTAQALFIHDVDDHETRFEGGHVLANTWPDARFQATQGLGHRRILRDRTVINSVVDFMTDRVVFQRPPETKSAQVAGSVAPLY